MSVLRNIEQKLEGLFEGTFSKAFKSEVQPIEIARKLAKEMDDNKTVSISRTYVPNQYTVYLSPQDRGQFEGWEDAARKELSDYLLQYARDEGLTLVAVDNGPGAVPIETAELPERCVLLFGQEGPGLTSQARAGAALTVSIAQFGSTRSINAGVAAGIAMHAWVRQHADLDAAC